MRKRLLRAVEKQKKFISIPGVALKEALASGYNASTFKADLSAGVVVGIVALPLAMALAIAVGVPPQYGLYTAIFAGFIIPFFGGSALQVSGPTAAFVVILAPIFNQYGLGGLLVSGFLSGLILMAMGVLRFGQLIQFIPHPVTTGFTAGIGTVIGVLQFKDLLGLQIEKTPDHFLERVQVMIAAAPTIQLNEVAVALGTLLLLVFVPRVTKRIPAPLIVLSSVALLVGGAGYFFGFEVSTIGNRFSTNIFGKIHSGIPQILPQFTAPWSVTGIGGAHFDLNFETLRQLLPSAFAIAMLGAIESLLSAVVGDGMSGGKHDPDAELFGQGIGNIVTPFFGGIPATGAIARTATNIRYGAKTPISAMIHSLFILLAVLLFAPLLSYLPMASLAALLVMVAWNMSEFKRFIHIVRVAPRSDVAVLLTCFVLTVLFDMVIAVAVGVVLAALLFMQRMASISSAKLIGEGHASPHVQLPRGVVLYEVAGPLFFGAADKAMDTLRLVRSDTQCVIFDMYSVPVMDETGLVAFENALNRLSKQGTLAIIARLQKQPQELLFRAGITEKTDKLAFSNNLEAALVIAQDRVNFK